MMWEGYKYIVGAFLPTPRISGIPLHVYCGRCTPDVVIYMKKRRKKDCLNDLPDTPKKRKKTTPYLTAPAGVHQGAPRCIGVYPRRKKLEK